MVIIAIGGLPGSGKSEVTKEFISQGFSNIYLPQVLFDILDEQGLPHNQEHERPVRERLRKEYGMAAFISLNLNQIKTAAQHGNVTLESMYSWEEYKLLKQEFGDAFIMVAVWSPPALRQKRLSVRVERRLRPEETLQRDYAQIERVNQAGPITMADHLIINTGSISELQAQARKLALTLSQE